MSNYSDSDNEDYGVSLPSAAPAAPAAPTANGTGHQAPSAGGGGGVSWERPWTLEEMRDRATDWRLAGDAGVRAIIDSSINRPG